MDDISRLNQAGAVRLGKRLNALLDTTCLVIDLNIKTAFVCHELASFNQDPPEEIRGSAKQMLILPAALDAMLATGEPRLFALNGQVGAQAGLIVDKFAFFVPFILEAKLIKELEHFDFPALRDLCTPLKLSTISPFKVLDALALLCQAYKPEKAIEIPNYFAQLGVNPELLPEISNEQANALAERYLQSAPQNELKHEQRLREAITHGSLQALKRAFMLPLTGQRSVLAGDSLRSLKNLTIVDITVATRAAIDAGVNGQRAQLLANGYILAVERAHNKEKIAELCQSCAMECCALVNDYFANVAIHADELVAAIELYVKQNLQRKFSLDEIGQALHFSGDHLNRLYKKITGRTIMEYLRISRVEAAKPLLIQAKLSASEIASLTGFSSQSHFIRVFKELTGLTPFKYQVRFEGRPFYERSQENSAP